MAKDINRTLFYNNHALNDDLIINHDESISFGEKQLSHHHVVNLPRFFLFFLFDVGQKSEKFLVCCLSAIVNILCLTKMSKECENHPLLSEDKPIEKKICRKKRCLRWNTQETFRPFVDGFQHFVSKSISILTKLPCAI